MNEKEAREICGIDGSCISHEGWEAKGYLEALAKAKTLEEALAAISLNPLDTLNHKIWANRALNKWEKEK